MSVVSPLVAPHAPRSSDDFEPAVSQAEADAILSNLDMDAVDHVQVYWVEGHHGKQALLQPIKCRWIGYVMVVALLLTARFVRSVVEPAMPWEYGRRPATVAARCVTRGRVH